VRDKLEHLVMCLILELRREARKGERSSGTEVPGRTARRTK
jgi:hypothetical protein